MLLLLLLVLLLIVTFVGDETDCLLTKLLCII